MAFHLLPGILKLVIRMKFLNVNKKCFFYMLRHANLDQYANGTGQPNISQASIANVEIACPNIQEQDKIIKEVELYEQEIAKAEVIIESIAIASNLSLTNI